MSEPTKDLEVICFEQLFEIGPCDTTVTAWREH